MQFERFYSFNQSIATWFANLHQVGFQRNHSQCLFLPKYHVLVLLEKQVHVFLGGKIKKWRERIWMHEMRRISGG
jgi:hypothetical protein